MASAVLNPITGKSAVKTLIAVTVDVLCRMRTLGGTKGISSDNLIISYLLQFYEETVKLQCARCQTTLEVYCAQCHGPKGDRANHQRALSMVVKQEVCTTKGLDHEHFSGEDSNQRLFAGEDSDGEPDSGNQTLNSEAGKTTHSSSETFDLSHGPYTTDDLDNLPISFAHPVKHSVEVSVDTMSDSKKDMAEYYKNTQQTLADKGAGQQIVTKKLTRVARAARKPSSFTNISRTRAGANDGSANDQDVNTTESNSEVEGTNMVAINPLVHAATGTVNNTVHKRPGPGATHTNRRRERRRTEYREQRGTPYRCSDCGESFALWKTFQNHLFENLDARYSYKCRHCEAVLRNFRDMKTHGHNHLTEMRHKCEYCGQTFPLKVNMRPHYLAHKKEGVLLCSICGKSFWILKNLQQHMRIHTGEKAFQCNWCGKCFTQKQQLIRHVRTHTGEKPYQCQYCPASFSQSDSLTRHLRKHSDDQGFQCEECGANFADKVMLKRHKRLIH